jgi:hypothetical protein
MMIVAEHRINRHRVEIVDMEPGLRVRVWSSDAGRFIYNHAAGSRALATAMANVQWTKLKNS